MAWFNRSKNDPDVQASIDYMDERFPFWLSKVLNIGNPVMDTSVDAAAIEYDKGTGEFTFRMNPEFSATLTDEERAFLMSHEAMHVVRNDMRTHNDPAFPDKEALNQAMDAIINDTLTNAGLPAPEWAVNGPRDVGYDCEDQPLADVYQTIIENRPPPEGGGDGDPDEDDDQSDPDDENDQDQDGDGSDGDQDADGDDDAESDPDEGEGEDDEADGDASGEDDPEQGEDEGDDGEGDTDGEDPGDDADGDGEGDDDGSDADGDGKPKPMAGGGHDGWSDQEGIEEAADEYDSETEGQPGSNEHSDAKKYEAPEGIVTEEQLDRLDFDAMLNLVEPELVDGFGMGHPPRADWRRPRKNMMALYPQTTLPSRRDDTRKLALASKRMQLVVFIDNSGSISKQDIALFRKLASRLPKARADYLFVTASSYAIEVPAEVLFDETKDLPYVGGTSSFPKRAVDGHNKDGDAYKTSKLMSGHAHGWRGCGTNGQAKGRARHYRMSEVGLNEFDAMNAWIKVAMEDGRLRSYPQSVMVISDAETMLTSSTQEEADRWVVFVNRHQSATGLHRGPTSQWASDWGCKIPAENVHRLADFLLNETHTVKKARV